MVQVPTSIFFLEYAVEERRFDCFIFIIVAVRGKSPRIMVMGALGRCGSGAVDCARKSGISE
jgi:hypothetical protein